MRKTVLLVGLTVGAAVRVWAQPATCTTPLATVTVPPQSYAEVRGAAFERRLFLYVPDVRGGGGRGFQPFTLWVVEGVYGRPFVQTSGRLEPSSFDNLRGSANVRATPIAVARGDGSDGGAFRFGRMRFRAVVPRASPKGGVEVRICP